MRLEDPIHAHEDETEKAFSRPLTIEAQLQGVLKDFKQNLSSESRAEKAIGRTTLVYSKRFFIQTYSINFIVYANAAQLVASARRMEETY